MKRALLVLMLAGLVLLLTGCGCKHSETELVNAVASTCTVEGYTGDTVCLECGKTVAKGKIIEMLPHTEEIVNEWEPTCTEEGYTGDTLCSTCGKFLATGEAIPATGHTEEEQPYGRREPTCTEAGYTGDICCADCGEVLREGERIEKLEHVPGEPQGAKEATCSSYGYTGDVFCTVGGEMIAMGESIEPLAHTYGEPSNAVEATCLREGYSGDRTCLVCGETSMGSPVPAQPHEYEENTCVHCGWRVSGLYVEGKLELTWQQLKDSGYVEVEEHALLNCSDNLMGTLVVDEEITSIPGYIKADLFDPYIGTFENMSAIEYIWLPRTVTAYGVDYSPTFAGCSKLRDVIAFGEMTEMGAGDVFANCSSLEKFEIPYGTKVIGKFCFFNCSRIKKLDIPDTVQVIGDAAFVQSGITEITLPEGVIDVDLDAFGDTAIKEVVLPSSVTNLTGVIRQILYIMTSMPESAAIMCRMRVLSTLTRRLATLMSFITSSFTISLR